MARISSHGSRASAARRRRRCHTACGRITDRLASGLFRTKTTLILFSYKIFNKYDFQKNILPDQHIILKFVTQKVKRGQKKKKLLPRSQSVKQMGLNLFICMLRASFFFNKRNKCAQKRNRFLPSKAVSVCVFHFDSTVSTVPLLFKHLWPSL